MTVSTDSESSYRPDRHCLGPIEALQPPMQRDDLAQPILAIEDRTILRNVANLLRLWAHSRPDLPDRFGDLINVTAVYRQPLALISIDVEHVARSLEQVEEPFDGSDYDAGQWPTADPFNLIPLEPPSFPAEIRTENRPLEGRESVRPCEECHGSGGAACAACSGAAAVPCPQCRGAKRIPCPRCDGDGEHVDVSGDVVPCEMCQTSGTVPCERCSATGKVECVKCGGLGRAECGHCNGYGKIKTRWSLATRTESRNYLGRFVRERWPGDDESLARDARVVASRQWTCRENTIPEGMLDGCVGPELLEAARSTLEECVADSFSIDDRHERISGVRLQLLGTYVYCVDFDYRGSAHRLFFGGATNQVFTGGLPTERAGMWKTIKDAFLRFWDPPEVDDRPVLEPAYISGVHGGRVHVSDHRSFVPLLAERMQIPYEITASGYRVALSNPSASATRGEPIVFGLDFLVDACDELLLCASCWLGPAHRDRAPSALELNHRLSFGRIAIVESPGTDQENFALVDRRVYSTLTLNHYVQILDAMVREASELHRLAVLS